MKQPITKHYLDYFTRTIDNISDDMLFKDNQTNIKKYFGLGDDDNSGYIFFSTENLFYNYSTFDKFYNALSIEIKQGDKTFPSLITILTDLKWFKDITKVVENLNIIIGDLNTQDKIFKGFNGFKFIDKELNKLLLKDIKKLTISEKRLRGRLLLQEILPVQQYNGGSMYDLSNVEYIKAFYQGKGTIRDNEYILKYLGCNVNMETVGSEVILQEVDWETYDTEKLDNLLKKDTTHQLSTTSQTKFSSDELSLDELLKNDAYNFKLASKGYNTLATTPIATPAEIVDNVEENTDEDGNIVSIEETKNTEDGVDVNILKTTIKNPNTHISSVKVEKTFIDEDGIKNKNVTSSKLGINNIILGQIQYSENSLGYSIKTKDGEETYINENINEKITISDKDGKRTVTTFKDDKKVDKITYPFSDSFVKTSKIENIYGSDDYYEINNYILGTDKIEEVSLISFDEDKTKHFNTTITVFKADVEINKISYKKLKAKFQHSLRTSLGEKTTSWKVISTLSDKRTVKTIIEDTQNNDKVFERDIYEDITEYITLDKNGTEVVTEKNTQNGTLETETHGTLDFIWEDTLDISNKRITNIEFKNFKDIDLSNSGIKNFTITSEPNNKSKINRIDIDGTRIYDEKLEVKRDLPANIVKFYYNKIDYILNLNYKTQLITLEVKQDKIFNLKLDNKKLIKKAFYTKNINEINGNITEKLESQCDAKNITFTYSKKDMSDEKIKDEPQVDTKITTDYSENKEVKTTLTIVTSKDKKTNLVTKTTTKKVETTEIITNAGKKQLKITKETTSASGKVTTKTFTRDYYNEIIGTTYKEENVEPTDEDFLLDTSNLNTNGNDEILDITLGDDNIPPEVEIPEYIPQTTVKDALFGTSETKDNTQIFNLEYEIDLKNPSFKGLFAGSVETMVEEMLAQRATAEVRVGKIDVSAKASEVFVQNITESMSRMEKYLETYKQKVSEDLAYQKTIQDCNNVFSRFDDLVSNACYSNVINSENKRVNNKGNDGVESFLLCETLSFADINHTDQKDECLTDIKKDNKDFYDIFKFVDNRIKKNINNIKAEHLSNKSTLDDSNHTMYFNHHNRDTEPLYLKVVSNQKFEKFSVNNKSFGYVKNLQITDDKFCMAPTFKEDKWEFNVGNLFQIEAFKYSARRETFEQELSSTHDVGETLDFSEELPYWEIKISDDDVQNQQRKISNLNPRNLSNIKFIENFSVIRNTSDKIDFTSTETIDKTFNMKFVDSDLMSKIENKNPDKIDNKHYFKMNNANQYTEVNTIEHINFYEDLVKIDCIDDLTFTRVFSDISTLSGKDSTTFDLKQDEYFTDNYKFISKEDYEFDSLTNYFDEFNYAGNDGLSQEHTVSLDYDTYSFQGVDKASKSFTKSVEDVYGLNFWMDNINGFADKKINNNSFENVSNVGGESEINNFVTIKREDGKIFDLKFDEITEDNYDWYVIYDVTNESESSTNLSSIT